MNRNNFGRFVVVIVVIIWAFVEMYPPVGRNLAALFQEKAVENRKDAAYTNVVERLQKLQQAAPQRGFANLVDAVDTNDITPYFPFYDVSQANANPSPARCWTICSGTPCRENQAWPRSPGRNSVCRGSGHQLSGSHGHQQSHDRG